MTLTRSSPPPKIYPKLRPTVYKQSVIQTTATFLKILCSKHSFLSFAQLLKNAA